MSQLRQPGHALRSQPCEQLVSKPKRVTRGPDRCRRRGVPGHLSEARPKASGPTAGQDPDGGRSVLKPLIVLLLLSLALVPIAAQQKGPARKPASPPARSAPAASTPRAERPVPFKPGETLSYDVSWSTYLTAGTATITVREKKPSYGSEAYYIVAEGRPTPLVSKLYSLYYKADTLLDVYTLLPQRGSVYSEEGKRHKLKVTKFDQAARRAQYEVRSDAVTGRDLSLLPYSQDVLSAVYVLRVIPLRPGATMTMPVCDNGSSYRVKVSVGGREMVKTGIGTVNAFRITPVIQDAQGRPAGRGLGLWISDDPRRLPVKLEAELAVGRFVVLLKEAR